MTRRDDINSLKGGMEGRNTIFDKITVRKDCVVPILPDADSEAASKKYVDGIFGTQNVVTSSRAANTVYQNKNTFPIFVSIMVYHQIYTTGVTLDGQSIVYAFCDTTIDPTGVLVAESELYPQALYCQDPTPGYNRLIASDMLQFIVPTSYYYKIEYSNSAQAAIPQLAPWIEYGGTGTAV